MLEFSKLWSDFPEKSVIKAKCQNQQASSSRPFGNYCAILLSEALIRSGLSTNNIPGNKCWSHDGMEHVLLAEDLAQWLSKASIKGLGQKEQIDPATFQDDLEGRTGIVFFKDYWQRGNETDVNRSGDHIDLWNNNEITSSSMLYRSFAEFFGMVSDLNNSKKIWFWEVK
ncbi:type VI secretion system amidase effector protein Tae4 [Marinobacter lacisalsi]|uniref:Type VI secretion system amidase effector protein Tae4 n=1 Tax=Marinobacter lacisalsi TaxID=475979 RepID=A0ABV8QDY9_9GAMM